MLELGCCEGGPCCGVGGGMQAEWLWSTACRELVVLVHPWSLRCLQLALLHMVLHVLLVLLHLLLHCTWNAHDPQVLPLRTPAPAARGCSADGGLS